MVRPSLHQPAHTYAEHKVARGFSPFDSYSFNNQKRNVNQMYPTSSPPPEECDVFCNDLHEGMFAARDEGNWTKIIKWNTNGIYVNSHLTICNLKHIYENTDDMCWHCKRDEAPDERVAINHPDTVIPTDGGDELEDSE